MIIDKRTPPAFEYEIVMTETFNGPYSENSRSKAKRIGTYPTTDAAYAAMLEDVKTKLGNTAYSGDGIAYSDAAGDVFVSRCEAFVRDQSAGVRRDWTIMKVPVRAFVVMKTKEQLETELCCVGIYYEYEEAWSAMREDMISTLRLMTDTGLYPGDGLPELEAHTDPDSFFDEFGDIWLDRDNAGISYAPTPIHWTIAMAPQFLKGGSDAEEGKESE